MKRNAVLLLLLLPGVAVAEVSDKIPPIAEVLVQGTIAAAITFAASRVRWWLFGIAAGWSLFLSLGLYELWEEKNMREAILHEQGIKYFSALLAEVGLVVTGGALGSVLNLRARRAQQGAPRDPGTDRPAR